jgi:hypothetical protein
LVCRLQLLLVLASRVILRSESVGLMTTFYRLIRGSQPGRPGPRIYIPQEQGGPIITPGAELPTLLILLALDSRYIASGRIQQKTRFPSL